MILGASVGEIVLWLVFGLAAGAATGESLRRMTIGGRRNDRA
jgi:hypothetical protein